MFTRRRPHRNLTRPTTLCRKRPCRRSRIRARRPPRRRRSRRHSASRAIAGTYIAGTADGGGLYVRFDGASRYSGPDSVACPSCSPATSPQAHLDFSLTTLHSTGGGAYAATGAITAESDPAWAAQLGTDPDGAGPVGSAVSFTVSSSGDLDLNLLPMTDVLRRSSAS